MNEPLAEVTFDKWLFDWHDEIVQAQEHSKTDLPSDAHLIQKDMSRTTTEFPRVGEWLAEVENFLIKSRAQETLAVKCDPKFGDLTGPERKVIVEARLAPISRTRDILKVTARALEERSFALMGQRRYAEAEMRMLGGRE